MEVGPSSLVEMLLRSWWGWENDARRVSREALQIPALPSEAADSLPASLSCRVCFGEVCYLLLPGLT